MNWSLESWLLFAGRLHPVMVHFGVALILVAAFMEIFRLKRSEPSRAARACLAFGVLGAGLAAFSGWQFALEGHGSSYPDSLFQHRWGGIAVASVAALTWIVGALARNQTDGVMLGWYRIGLLTCAAGVSYVGFLGGEMMHGEGHLIEVFEEDFQQRKKRNKPAPAPAELTSVVADAAPEELPSEPVEPADPAETTPEPMEAPTDEASKSMEPAAELVAPDEPLEPVEASEPVAEVVDYATQVQPIFEANCYECHGPTGKAKGGLRLHSRPELFEGDEEFWIMLPGNAEGSYLVELISMPADSEDVMPPGKGDQPSDVLSQAEIDLIKRWIDQGAKFEQN